MIRRWVWLVVGLAGCVPRAPAPVPNVHYVVGGGYRLNGTWSYPREDFHLDQTGLAAVLPQKRGLTADGEAYEPTAMVAAHRTLQLPAVVRVTNLQNGLETLVRVNDRGPVEPGRVIGLSRRAAAVLGIAPGQPVRVRVEEGMSQALRAQVGGGPTVTVAAAPRAGVSSESLPPPPGVGQSRRGREVVAVQQVGATAEAQGARVPDRLPEVAGRVIVQPGRLLIRAGSFGRMEYASRLQARLGGDARVEQAHDGQSERYEVIAGPYTDVAAADGALDRAVRAGVTDARIVVE